MLPNKLEKGDYIGLISPSSAIEKDDLEIINNSIMLMEGAGFKVKFGNNVLLNSTGYGATAKEKAEDINNLFKDKEVKAIFCISGGFNSNSVFEYLDFDAIKYNPKIICGFSDSTSLTNIIYAKTDLITFNGPTFKSLTSWQTEYGFKEVMINNHTGYIVKRKDINAISLALNKLIENVETRKNMGKSGRKRVVENYDWNKNVEYMKKVYEKCYHVRQINNNKK